MKASLARSVEDMDDGEVWGRATMKRFSQDIVASNSPQSRRPAAVLLRQPPAAAAAGLHARAPAGLHARPPPAVSTIGKAAPTRPPETGKENSLDAIGRQRTKPWELTEDLMQQPWGSVLRTLGRS
jgi:hypothetical protein